MAKGILPAIILMGALALPAAADDFRQLWNKLKERAGVLTANAPALRRIPPEGYGFPIRGKLKVYFINENCICVGGNYTDFLRERFVLECGDFLSKLDAPGAKVAKWSYDFHYNFAALEVMADYNPRIKAAFEDKDNFTLRGDDGHDPIVGFSSYWPNAIGQMRVPVSIEGAELKMVNSAELAHFSWLTLKNPLRNGISYTLKTKAGEELRFTYDDHKVVSRAIKVNQVGYAPGAGRKYAYLGAWLGPVAGELDLSAWAGKPFEIINEATGVSAFKGAVKPRSREQYFRGEPGKRIPLNGEDVYELDFSALNTPGRYHCYVPGIGRSWSFEIGDDAIGRAYYTHIRGLYHQRSGIRKGPPHTFWKMDADHTESYRGGFSPDDRDYRKRNDGGGYFDDKGQPVDINSFAVVRDTATNEKLDVYGGWWDAGDFDRRLYHFRIVSDLLSAYLMYPEKFPDNQTDIPESGNGIPDIIDEAAWGVEVWRKAQNADGGVGCWLEADSHPVEFNPAKDKQRYYLALPTRESTMHYAAHAALLARALKSCGATEKAQLYQESAVRAFNYAINPANRVINSFLHKPANSSVPLRYTYREPPEIDKLMIFKAALNLHHLTGDDKYTRELNDNNFKELMRRIDYPYNPFMLTELLLDTGEFSRYADEFKRFVIKQADTWLTRQDNLAYRNLNWPLDHAFFRNLSWGNAIPFNKGRYFIAAHRLTGNAKYRDAALLLNDWMCGTNPMGRTMTTGLGIVSPVRTLSLASYTDGILEQIPGITPYTFTFHVHMNSLRMVHGMKYPARPDHKFPGLDICMLPEALVKGQKLPETEVKRLMDDFYPVWRRFCNVEQYAVEQNEFTVWETIGPSAAFMGCLLPDAWKAPTEWRERQPAKSLDELEGYMFLP